MGKVKLLLDVIEDIRSLADSLEAVAEACASVKLISVKSTAPS